MLQEAGQKPSTKTFLTKEKSIPVLLHPIVLLRIQQPRKIFPEHNRGIEEPQENSTENPWYEAGWTKKRLPQ